MCYGPAAGRTDGLMDGPMDGQSLLLRCVDASKKGVTYDQHSQGTIAISIHVQTLSLMYCMKLK